MREGDVLSVVSTHTARQMHYAIIMPNLRSPIVYCTQAEAYYNQIIHATSMYDFYPLMTLYLTDHTSIEDIAICAQFRNYTRY